VDFGELNDKASLLSCRVVVASPSPRLLSAPPHFAIESPLLSLSLLRHLHHHRATSKAERQRWGEVEGEMGRRRTTSLDRRGQALRRELEFGKLQRGRGRRAGQAMREGPHCGSTTLLSTSNTFFLVSEV
jgi:hypothetical protein